MREKTAAAQGKRALPAIKNAHPASERSLGASLGPQPSLESEFQAQAEQWRRETLHTSSLTRMVMHPSYLRIIGMGRGVLPFLFKELSQRPDHWLVALNAITGEDPAPADSTFDEAVTAWLDWGRKHGYSV
jgi:hypothetical protein